MFEIVYDRRRTDDGRTDAGYDGYTISSPCEPNGSGELKILINLLIQIPKSYDIETWHAAPRTHDLPSLYK